MQSLVCTSPGEFEYQTAEKPLLQKGHTILEIKRIGICGTDLHRVAFENVKEMFAGFLDPANGVIKAMIEIK